VKEDSILGKSNDDDLGKRAIEFLKAITVVADGEGADEINGMNFASSLEFLDEIKDLVEECDKLMDAGWDAPDTITVIDPTPTRWLATHHGVEFDGSLRANIIIGEDELEIVIESKEREVYVG
jgi:hypothetical protein